LVLFPPSIESAFTLHTWKYMEKQGVRVPCITGNWWMKNFWNANLHAVTESDRWRIIDLWFEKQKKIAVIIQKDRLWLWLLVLSHLAVRFLSDVVMVSSQWRRNLPNVIKFERRESYKRHHAVRCKVSCFRFSLT